MQGLEKVLPVSVNTNKNWLKLQPTEATFLKGYRFIAGLNETGQQGGNEEIGKKLQSNWQLILLDLPAGTNKSVGFFENKTLNEGYVFNWNALGKHTIYVLYGDTLTSEIVYQGPELEFTLDPRNYISPHRAYVRLIYDVYNDEERHVKEKGLFFTNGYGWQKWVNILSSIATKSYNAILYPYYTLHGPHFDKNELVDYAVRPPMYAPVLTAIARTAADKGMQNHLLGKGIKMAFRYIYTDGRPSSLSPHSNPLFVKKASCSSSKNVPRSYDVAMYAGSPHVERIQVLMKSIGGDWMLYDTIDRFDSEGANARSVIGDQYWLRSNQWGKYNYDAATNTIHYTFSGDREVTLFPKEDAEEFYNDVPIKSYALTAVGDELLWCNNLRGYDNIPSETTKQFDFEVAQGDLTAGSCKIKNSKIVLYAYMARNSEVNQVVYTVGGDNIKRFGGVYPKGKPFGSDPDDVEVGWEPDESKFFGADFGNNDNFICYLAGTPYSSIGVQYRVDSNGDMTKVGALDSNNNEHKVLIKTTFQSRGFFVQRFEFNVPAGNYIARLARHDADLGESYQQTSGWVQGIFDHTQLFTSSGDFKSNAVTEFRKEFTIDSTAGDVDMWGKGNDMFYVFVPYQPGSNAHFRFVEGHVWEDGTTKLPIELVHYYVNKGADNLKRIGSFTDHNGAYFAYTVKDLAFLAEVIFDPAFFQCVANAKLFNTTISNLAGEEDGHFQNVNLTIADHYTAEIAVNNRIVVKGKVVDCDSGLGIPSVGVTLEFGPTFYTDSDGNFTYYAREHWAGRRLGNFYINTGGECLFTGCGCSPVGLIPFDTQGLPCGVNSPRYWPTDLSISLKVLDQNGRGLKTGGHYGISFHLGDLAGRVNYSQNLKYIDIPTFMETGVFTPSQIKWSLKGKLNLPSWAKYIFFARTNNLSANKYLQWVGDKIDFIDNKGNIVMDGNGAIRAKITIKSLLDFNIQSNFNTNVNYQFVQGDIMRVMDDGDNNLFNPANTDGFMDYQVLGTTYNQTIASEQSNQTTITSAVTKDGSGNTTSTTETVSNSNPVNVNDDGVSFIVEFDERLLQLKDKTGFWIELIRPRDISSVESYYEIVGSIPVIGGEPMVTSGTLDTFDTFYQVRSIKIPNALGKSYGHPFESASVTDFFMLGDCSSNGRVNVKDPQASQIWIEDETARTDEIFNAGRVNGLGHCRTKNRKNFKSQTFGGIVAAHADRNRITMICEHDWIIADFDDNQLKVTAQGFVTANMENTISNPYPKEGSYYGCAYEDTATIVFADGMCVWADRHNSAIVALDYHHNQSSVPVGYRNAVDIAAEDMRSYFVNKFNYVLGFNAKLSKADYLANLIELVGGLDPMTGEYNITFRPRMGLKTDPQYFVNNEREIFYDTAETLVYNPDLKKWNGWTGYAPECYGTLSKSSSGVELITFAAGAPWFHNSIGQKSTNVFYGVETEQVIEVALNVANELDKIYQMLYVLSPVVKYFTDRILTQQKNFFSYMPLSHFSRVGKQLHASFKCNMAGYPNPIKPVNSLLMDGDRTTGKVALVRLVADPNNNPEYAELNAIHYRITAEGRTESK